MSVRSDDRYTTPPTVEEIFDRHLSNLCSQIRSRAHCGLVYTVGRDFACKKCGCRLFVRESERIHCIGCGPVPWNEATRQAVQTIMAGYPTVEQCEAEMSPRLPSVLIERRAIASQYTIARERLGWSIEEAAARILRTRGDPIAPTTLAAIEQGKRVPSEQIRAQLERLLGIREEVIAS